ncbi:homocysteine S-methyltransferase [Campylobacter geochelonis]|uniref:homocysteine S-methyltransferase n=1 Tax=Campylobacter geochelonis TaxID=1780362 RepID=UPI000770A63D|nr:homocysteine S-methyltransferase [Campylobacter geochelonis]CZE47328.1 Homocysteine S-methyltransferase [Campylobacter geochelonis]
MGKFRDLLEKKRFVLLDGALGTQLERSGFDISGELWSARFILENPQALSQIHADYLKAGCDIITTSGYQASFKALCEYGLSANLALNMIKKTVFIAKDEVKKTKSSALVAASFGPYGAYLADGSEFSGSYKLSQDEYFEFYQPTIKAVLEAKADVLCFETIPNFDEIRALCALLKSEFNGCEAWISCSAKNESQICDGSLISEVASFLNEQENIVAFGINCTKAKFFNALLKAISFVSNKPLIAYPNGGGAYDGATQSWICDKTHTDLDESFLAWAKLGVRIMGGCCNTTPEDIARLKVVMDRKNNQI